MGKKFAPNYANLFLAEWEEKALEKCVLKPSVYWRFLDDIFMIWEHSKEEFYKTYCKLCSTQVVVESGKTIGGVLDAGNQIQIPTTQNCDSTNGIYCIVC